MPAKYDSCVKKVSKSNVSRYGYQKYNPYAVCKSSMLRKGMGAGKGSGYFNLAPLDSHIHRLSAMGIMSVQRFHREIAQKQYDKALQEYQKGKRTQPPFRPLYFYTTKSGDVRKTGYVAVTDTGSHYGKIKKNLMERINKGKKGKYGGWTTWARGLTRDEKYRAKYNYVRSPRLLKELDELKKFYPDMKTGIVKDKHISATNRYVEVGGKRYHIFLRDGGNMSNGESVMYVQIYNLTDNRPVMTANDTASWMPSVAYIYSDLKGISPFDGAKEMGY
jgi:hypothetical protein